MIISKKHMSEKTENIRIRLMLVRDPENTVKALCNLSGTFDLYDYKRSYEKICDLSSPIHIKNAHTHFYSLRIFGLITHETETPKGVYVISDVGKEICAFLHSNNITEVEKKMRFLLLNNFEKGALFKDFENYISKSLEVSFLDIEEKYDNLTAASLISWSKFAGMIDVDKNLKKVFYRKFAMGEDIPLEEFFKKLVEEFKRMKTSEVFGIDRLFVDINKIRREMCLKLDWSHDQWNQKMTDILDSEYGPKIRLYGSTARTYEMYENFIYKKRRYAFIRIKLDED